MKIPKGFEELVDIIESKREKPHLVDNDTELWSHFCWSVLLGGNRIEAEVNFVYDIFVDSNLFKRKNLNSVWLEKAKRALLYAKSASEEPNRNGKIAAITKIEKEIGNIETTIKSADEILKNMGLNATYLKSIAGNIEKEKNLLSEIAAQDETVYIKYGGITKHVNKIPGVAYTKALIWLHSCGVGFDFVPNNNHSVNFLKECDKTWVNNDFFVVNKRFQSVCSSIRRDIYYSGLAMWYYETTKNFVRRKYKTFYNPKKFITIMEKNELSIDEISELLTDIESIEVLEEILNEGYEKHIS